MNLDSLLNRKPPTHWEQFFHSPCLYLAQRLYHSRAIQPAQKSHSPITIVCISDTHNTKPELPPGEIIIHAGDSTQSGTLQEFQATIDWLDSFPHRHKVLIGGNHDLLLDSKIEDHQDSAGRSPINWRSVIYLENKDVTLRCTGGRQIQIYGSPLTPQHGNWAFQYPRNHDVWQGTVPLDTQILVTHGPPKGHLDLGSGCDFLLNELWRVKPQLHVFGHIHAGYGQEWIQFDDQQRVFEEILKARGGMGKLILLLYKSITALFSRTSKASTLLVNAAVVGGFRDEMMRSPVVVQL